jgi:hypothetical protein
VAVDDFLRHLERKRLIRERVEVVIATGYIDQLETVVDRMYEAIQTQLLEWERKHVRDTRA